MLRKITFALLGLTATFSHAGTQGTSCNPDHVTVPCESKSWDLGIKALYLQPVYGSSQSYVVSGFNNYSVNNQWGWGYELEGSYYFGTGNDIHMDWTHYDVSSGNGNFPGNLPLGLGATTFNLQSLNRFDQVNLVMGQHADFGIVKNLRFYGGIQYANIRNDMLSTYQPTPIALLAGVTGGTQHNNSDFNGVGPVIGIDYAYDLLRGLSITANTASSILYGTARGVQGFVFAPTNLVPASSYASTNSIVPGVEAKLGLNYAQALGQGMLNLSGGYQVLNYFNALSVIGLTNVPSTNFGLYGPYFGLNWRANA